MILAESVVHAGLTAPVRLFHLTDTHVTLSNEHDCEYAVRQQAERRAGFGQIEKEPPESLTAAFLREASDADCIVMTGDIIDAPSEGNLAYLRETLSGLDCFYVTGNHDWCFPDDHPDGAEGQRKLRASVERASGFPIDFCTRRVGGLTLIGLDNSEYQVTAEQAAQAAAVLERGEPTVLCCHVPFYCDTLWESARDYWQSPILVGCPEDVLSKGFTHPDCLRPTPETAAFVERLRGFPNLAAILAGHVHYNHTDRFSEHTVQIVTQAAFHAPIAERMGRTVPHAPGNARWVYVD